ncbi:MAG: Rieske (2Fe-2S) protein [Xanthomonadales bacterium]
MKKPTATRRTFLNRLWLGIGGLALLESVALVANYLRPRPSPESAGAGDPVVIAGPVDRFEPGSVTAFVQGRFYLSRLEDGGFLALSRTCTHLSCSVPGVADEERFLCPCHASAFDRKGDVLQPPAPRAMDLFEVVIEHGIVRVDTGKRVKRTAFASGQATYPVQA